MKQYQIRIYIHVRLIAAAISLTSDDNEHALRETPFVRIRAKRIVMAFILIAQFDFRFSYGGKDLMIFISETVAESEKGDLKVV